MFPVPAPGRQPVVRLVACHICHAQFDVTRTRRDRFRCACGAMVEARVPEPIEVPVHRCAACGAGLEVDAEICGYCRAAVERDPSRLGLVCPECFARTVEGGRFCVGCGIEIRPCEAVPDDLGLACPVCEAALGAVTVDRVVIRECAGCGGSWIRNEDFDAIVARVQTSAGPDATSGLGGRSPARPVTTSEPVSYRRCPECRQVMHRRNFGRSSGVIVDWCREHGTWLDATELEAVAAFVRRGGLDDRPRALPEEVARAVRSFDRVPLGTRPASGAGGSLADILLSLLT